MEGWWFIPTVIPIRRKARLQREWLHLEVQRYRRQLEKARETKEAEAELSQRLQARQGKGNPLPHDLPDFENQIRDSVDERGLEAPRRGSNPTELLKVLGFTSDWVIYGRWGLQARAFLPDPKRKTLQPASNIRDFLFCCCQQHWHKRNRGARGEMVAREGKGPLLLERGHWVDPFPGDVAVAARGLLDAAPSAVHELLELIVHDKSGSTEVWGMSWPSLNGAAH